MVLFSGALGVVAFAVWLFCIIDVITTPRDQARNLPKLAWLVLVVLLVDFGSIGWLVFGRPWGAAAASSPRPAKRRPTNPDDDEEFLASLSARAEEQRRARESDEDGTAEKG